MALTCLPSDIDNEANKDIQAIKTLISAKNEYNERNNEMLAGG